MALLAGHPDPVHAGHGGRGPHGVNHAIDVALEIFDVGKGLDVERDDQLTGIGQGFVVLVEIDHVTAHGGAVQGAGQQPVRASP